MSRDEQERLRDIQDAITAIREHLAKAGEATKVKDLIAHEYFRIDINRVLEIVERDLTPLEHAISRMQN